MLFTVWRSQVLITALIPVGNPSATRHLRRPKHACALPPRQGLTANVHMTKAGKAQLKLSTILLAFAMVAGAASAVGAATASWDPNTEPDVAGYKLSYGTQPGVHTNVIDVGRVTTYQFNPAPGLRYYVVVQAYNTAGQLSEKSAEAIIDIPLPSLQPLPNLPPTLSQPANQSSTVGASVSLALSASDPDGTALKFSASGLPPELSLNSSSGLITGVARTIGAYQVTVTVSDGALSASRSFGWSIVDVAPKAPSSNLPPAMVQPLNQTSTVNETISLALVASDPEGKTLKFTATGLPNGLSLDSASGLISGKPRGVSTNQVTVTVSDGELSASRSFTWTVSSSSPGNGKKAIDLEIDSAQLPLVQEYVGVSGDFDGDGRPDLATYRPSSSEWRIWTSGSNFLTSTLIVWGLEGDVPLAADYNGDRVTDLAVYRPSTGTWHLWLSHTQTPLALHWGGPEDTPVALDHDGDGKADLALVRNGGYEILLSSTNYLTSVTVR